MCILCANQHFLPHFYANCWQCPLYTSMFYMYNCTVFHNLSYLLELTISMYKYIQVENSQLGLEEMPCIEQMVMTQMRTVPSKNTHVQPTRSTRNCRQIRHLHNNNSDDGDDSDSDFEVQMPTKYELNTEETSSGALCKLLSSTNINSEWYHSFSMW